MSDTERRNQTGSLHQSPAAAADAAPGTEPLDLPKPLTDREMEVLQCLPTRLSTVEIGESLNISANTVKTHLRSIYNKLGARSRNEAILQGAKYHLVGEQAERLVRH